MILAPSCPQTDTIARVWTSGNCVLCSFKESREDFRAVVKTAFGCQWDEARRAWSRSINSETGGTVSDRCAELTAKLVGAGFSVEVADDVSVLVQFAAWEPEHKRWVKAINGKFHLWWRGKNENLFARANTLPDSHYESTTRAVSIPSLYFAEVEGFAEEHDFRFTQTAQDLLIQAKASYARTVLPSVSMPTAKPRTARKERGYEITKFMDIPQRRISTTTTLMPHQVKAVEKIMPLRVGALFMDMGTGKTRCAIELVARRQARIRRVIWFCPVSLKTTIHFEIEKHTSGEAVHVFDDKTGPENIPDAFWYVVGIESLSSSDRVVLAVNELIDEDTFIIVDESTYIKGHASKRSMRVAEMGKRSRYRLLLTGTPLTQGVEDLFGQMRFLSTEILGYESFYSFAKNHLEYSEKYPGMIVRSLHVGQLADRISPFIYQVTKEECMDLPDKIYDQIYFDLTGEQVDAYRKAKDEILNGIMDEIPDYIIFQLFTALQQIVSGWWNRNGNEFIRLPHKRIDALQTVVSGIPENEKIIIWCKYVDSVRQIAEALPGCALYYGDMSEAQRDEQLQNFRASARFLVATMATGGHGLTLNEAHYHIFYENEFKYSHRIQAEDRSHRIGQTEHVTYIDVVSNSGIDRRIMDAIAKKEDVVKSFRYEVNKRKVTEL